VAARACLQLKRVFESDDIINHRIDDVTMTSWIFVRTEQSERRHLYIQHKRTGASQKEAQDSGRRDE
jgi:hypothetical protein